jgi:hypothetical protein
MPKSLRKFRRVEKKETQYLVQEREGMDDVIYIATPDLEKRSDMHPVSATEANDYLAEQYPDSHQKTEAPEPTVEETGAQVIEDLQGSVEEPHEEKEDDFVKVPDAVAPKTDPKNAIGVDRDTDVECQLIMSFTKKNQIEHYLLVTHDLEIDIAEQKLVDLKEEAISAVIAKRIV